MEKYTYLIKRFDKWRKSSDNVIKKESLLDQVELFQFCEDEVMGIDASEFVGYLVQADKKYSRLTKRSKKDEFWDSY